MCRPTDYPPYEDKKKEISPPTCTQCGAIMNPVQVMLGPVCGKCVRANHKAATGGK